MKEFYLAQLVILLLGAALIGIFKDIASSLAFGAGVITITINVAVIQYLSVRLLTKKPVAWTLFVIVLKYTLLGYVLYVVATEGLLPVGWFCLGLATIITGIFGIKRSAL